MRVSLLAALVLLTMVGCGRSDLFPFDSIEGQWDWQFNANPAGSGVSLSLTTSGSAVRGTGAICGVGPACSPGAVMITGQLTRAATRVISAGTSFQLTIRGDSGFVATYVGQLVSRNELKGTWVEGNASNTMIFYRK